MTRRDFFKTMACVGLINSVPSYAVFPVPDDTFKDKELRKRVIKKDILSFVKEVDSYIANDSHIKEIHNAKDSKEIVYHNDDSTIPLNEWHTITRTIYYNKTLREIYAMKQAEYIAYRDDPLSIAQMIYPAKMPTKDYFPFIEFDIGTKIPLLLTEEEKQRYKEDLEAFSSLTIDKYLWTYCILWLDSHRMYITMYYYDYYFKQVGKDLHFIKIIDHSTV